MLANTTGHNHDPRQHEFQVVVPGLALDRAAEQEHEQGHEHDRLQGDVEKLLGIAPDPHQRSGEFSAEPTWWWIRR
jgi:hypothetical protein